MGGDDELGEILLKLGQQAAEASPEERERALEIASANGDYLMMKFGLCMKRIRRDLAPDIKAGALDDMARFMQLFNAVKQWPPKAAAHVFELAEVALNTGLRVGLSPSEIEDLRKEMRRGHSQPGGKESGKTRGEKAEQWKKWVTDNAPPMRANHPRLGWEDLAEKLIALATSQPRDFNIPDRDRVARHLSAMHQAGQLSERTRSRGERTRSRTKPVR